MQGNRGRDTGPELILRRALVRRGLLGYRINWNSPCGKIDIAFVDRRIAILVHGCFWHRCPRCRPSLPKAHKNFWREKFSQNRRRDRRMERKLKAAGWRVLVAWECEIEQDLASLVERVAAAHFLKPAGKAR